MTHDKLDTILKDFLHEKSMPEVFATLQSLDEESRTWLLHQFMKTSGYSSIPNGTTEQDC